MPREAKRTLADTEAACKAREFGIDVTLIEQNLKLSPTQRLQKLQQRIGSINRLREGMRGK